MPAKRVRHRNKSIICMDTAPADTVLIGNIYTCDPQQPWVEAVAVRQGQIFWTGAREKVYLFTGPKTVTLDSQDGIFLPGFYDAHIHAISGALIEMQCNLYSAKSIEEARETILKYCQANPHQEYITGSGWKHNWPELVNGTVLASMVDDIVPDKPFVVRRWDSHSVWVNTSAMKMANITKETLSQYNPSLIPCDADGNPLGCFHEEAADIFLQFLKEIPLETRRKALDYATKIFAKHGIVGWHDALARSGTLTLYVNPPDTLKHKVGMAFWWDPQKPLSQIEEFKAQMNTGKGLIRKTIKIMLDGVIQTQTALLHQPYCNCANEDFDSTTPNKPNYGCSPFENLEEVVALCDKEGFQLHFHTVGDKAVTWALNAIENARAINGPRDNRHEASFHPKMITRLITQLAHLQIVQPSDIPRFKQLDVIANFQPLWCECKPFTTQPILGVTTAKLTFEPLNFFSLTLKATACCDKDLTAWIGTERTKLQYPIKQMADLDTKICFGSDWHVSDFEPLIGIHVAVNHRLKKEHPVWEPGFRLSIEQAIQYYTIGSAYACFREKESGSIEVGKACDVVLLEKNLFKIDPMEIKDTKVLMTMIDGEIIYDAKSPVPAH